MGYPIAYLADLNQESEGVEGFWGSFAHPSPIRRPSVAELTPKPSGLIDMIKKLFQQPWFWPQDVREDPGFINRMGRVFHWTLIAVSAPLFAIGAVIGVFGTLLDTERQVGGLMLCTSVAAWMIGRGARYIFSGE
jgi:hypothetical protein